MKKSNIKKVILERPLDIIDKYLFENVNQLKTNKIF